MKLSQNYFKLLLHHVEYCTFYAIKQYIYLIKKNAYKIEKKLKITKMLFEAYFIIKSKLCIFYNAFKISEF